jgi:hypothetical protein
MEPILPLRAQCDRVGRREIENLFADGAPERGRQNALIVHEVGDQRRHRHQEHEHHIPVVQEW